LRNAPQVPLDASAPPWAHDHAAWKRLQDQIAWYDSKSQHAQRWYKRLRIGQVTLAVSIPLMAFTPPPLGSWGPAAAGALIALLEATQELNQFAMLWPSYRGTAEHLKHEKFLFLSGAGAYKGLAQDERLITLAERVEEHVSVEHANWVAETRRRSTSHLPQKSQT
jgi:Protein of unknown function (DUF4231)